MTTSTEQRLDPGLIDAFCEVFGERWRKRLGPGTTMDDVDGWDSMTFLDFVSELEERFDVTFTDDEAAQMFQLGHVQRLLDAARLDLPHEDEANACCLLHRLREQAASEAPAFRLVMMSGSSTREGLLRPHAVEERLATRVRTAGLGDEARWFNLSVSGLVAAETLRLLELVPAALAPGDDGRPRGAVAIGTSPVILGGCGVAEFERSVNLERMPFVSGTEREILARHGYRPEPGRAGTPMTLELWIERYLKGRDLEQLHYEPYIYPGLAAWTDEKHRETASILRFYNDSVLNHEESRRINRDVYHAWADWRDRTGVPLVLVELTLHPATAAWLEDHGGLVSAHDAFVREFVAERGVPLVSAATDAGVVPADFRDPAHLAGDEARGRYTDALLDGVIGAVAGHGRG